MVATQARTLAVGLLLLACAGAAPTALQDQCVKPGKCTPPDTKYSLTAVGPSPGVQWEISGGFCGSWSLQQAALAHGAWLSQDLVRKANKDWAGPHVMHGDGSSGYEVIPINVAYTAEHLRLVYNEWDYNSTKPQAARYKRWLKSHLVAGHTVVWFPMCKGDDGDGCYGGPGCPNEGRLDHVEPMFGIFSNHPLNDTQVYDDDWILHASDQDHQPYYRTLNSLDDSTAMQGNCKDAQAYPGRNEMFPCFDASVTYGIALEGLRIEGALPTALQVFTDDRKHFDEPNVRMWRRSMHIYGTIHVTGLVSGNEYGVYRYNSTAALPRGPPFHDPHHVFTAADVQMWWGDPTPFQSHSVMYYVVAPIEK